MRRHPSSTVVLRSGKPAPPSSRFEEEALAGGAERVAGIDEAGRGPLAGPVVAAAVILFAYDLFSGLHDSKILTERQREELFPIITEHAVGVGVGIVPPEIIDRINILQATRMAMAEAVACITPPPDYLLIDGPISVALPISQKSIIKGDRLSISVAAASVVAKVTRDRIMRELHEHYPVYGFDRHKGYPTAAHRDAILRHGPSPVHRLCFRGVKGI